jgi:hypothetical protein
MDHPIRNRLLVLLGMIVFGALGVFTCKGFPQRFPPVEGRIIDARTGKPLPGVFVRRGFYKPGPFDLVDTRAPVGVRGSFSSTSTDQDGRFSFPAFWSLRLTGMAWLAFTPGYMPAGDCYAKGSWPFGGCSGFSVGSWPDPWAPTTYTWAKDRLSIELKLFPPTLDGVAFLVFDQKKDVYVPFRKKPDIDPWQGYFERLSSLVRLHWLQPEVFVDEASKAIETRTVTAGAFEIISAAMSNFYLGSTVGDSQCWKGELAWRLFDIESKACALQPSWEPCASGIFLRQRANLERNCKELRR